MTSILSVGGDLEFCVELSLEKGRIVKMEISTREATMRLTMTDNDAKELVSRINKELLVGGAT